MLNSLTRICFGVCAGVFLLALAMIVIQLLMVGLIYIIGFFQYGL